MSSQNSPESRDHADQRKLVADHEKNKGPDRPCFWKHEQYGTSTSECVRIPAAEYDTHACHYRKNGINQAESRPDIYNTRHGRKNNQEVAVKLGYLKVTADSNGTPTSGRVLRDTEEYRSTAVAIAAYKSSTTSSNPETVAESIKKGKSFLEAYRARYVKSLYWLLRDPQGWDVGYRAALDPRHLRKVYGATRDNEASDKSDVYKKLARKLGTAPKNFAIKESKVSPGLGKWYPYEHDHHHILPAGTFQEKVLNGPSPAPGIDYMSRAAVVMKGNWNVHHEKNMILLPNETYPARILDLPAHIPWQMGADHPSYSETFDERLEAVRDRIDTALKKQAKRHDAADAAAVKIKDMLERLSTKARENILRGGFFVLEPK